VQVVAIGLADAADAPPAREVDDYSRAVLPEVTPRTVPSPPELGITAERRQASGVQTREDGTSRTAYLDVVSWRHGQVVAIVGTVVLSPINPALLETHARRQQQELEAVFQ
jgi:hypothetical protein